MAQITKVNGTTQPVFAIDVQNGTIANTANIAAGGPVQVAGPKLDFFSLTANSALSASGAANATGGLNIGIPTANVAGSATFTNV